jgi:hypothetical protein
VAPASLTVKKTSVVPVVAVDATEVTRTVSALADVRVTATASIAACGSGSSTAFAYKWEKVTRDVLNGTWISSSVVNNVQTLVVAAGTLAADIHFFQSSS